jgi:hypothetical protein
MQKSRQPLQQQTVGLRMTCRAKCSCMCMQQLLQCCYLAGMLRASDHRYSRCSVIFTLLCHFLQRRRRLLQSCGERHRQQSQRIQTQVSLFRVLPACMVGFRVDVQWLQPMGCAPPASRNVSDASSAETEAVAAAKPQPKKKRRESGMLKAVKAELAAERAEAIASAAPPASAGRSAADASAAVSVKKGKAAKASAANGSLQQQAAIAADGNPQKRKMAGTAAAAAQAVQDATAADGKPQKRKKAATGAAAPQAVAGGKAHKKEKRRVADAQPAVDAALDAQLLASSAPAKAAKKAVLAAVSGRPAKGADTQQQKQAALKRKMLKMKATTKPNS